MDRYVSTELRLCDTDKKFPQNEVFIVDDVYEEIVEQLPSVQPERKTGRWIESNPQNSKLCRLMTCSECGKAYIVNINVPYEDWTEAHKFCVECGAKMEGETE